MLYLTVKVYHLKNEPLLIYSIGLFEYLNSELPIHFILSHYSWQVDFSLELTLVVFEMKVGMSELSNKESRNV